MPKFTGMIRAARPGRERPKREREREREKERERERDRPVTPRKGVSINLIV